MMLTMPCLSENIMRHERQLYMVVTSPDLTQGDPGKIVSVVITDAN